MVFIHHISKCSGPPPPPPPPILFDQSLTSLFLYTRRLCCARLLFPSHERTKIIDEDVEIIDIL